MHVALVVRYIGNYPRNALLFACCAVKFIVLRIYSAVIFGKPLTSRQINCKILQYVGKVYPFPTQNTDGQFVVLRRNIVKKYISLILALTILVGMLGVSAMAFAEDAATVTVDQTALDAKIAEDDALKALSGNFSLNLGELKVPAWLATEADISALFSGANFVSADGKLTDASDKVEIQYFKPGSDRGEVAEDKDKKAGYAAAEEQIDVNSVGWWSFRFVVVRPHATVENAGETDEKTTYSVDYTKDIVAKSQLVSLYAQDVDNPIITLNQTRYDDYTKKGITVGTRYSIPTTLLFTMTDDGKGTSSSYITVYYVIEKMIASAGEGGNFIHIALNDSGRFEIVFISSLSVLEICIGILRGTLLNGVFGVERARAEVRNGVHIHKFFHLVVIYYVDFGNFVAGSEAVKEMKEGNFCVKRGKMSDQSQIHNFLNGAAGEHCKTRLAASHNVRMVAENVKRMSGKSTRAYVENRGQ